MRTLQKYVKKRTYKHIRGLHLGAAAFRSVYALLDPRRLKHIRLLFQRPVLGAIKGHAWLPRSW